MAKNGYVTTREFQTVINRIDSKTDKIEEKLDGLQISFVGIKTHFNDELQETITKAKWKYGIGMAGLGGLVSLIVTLLVRFYW